MAKALLNSTLVWTRPQNTRSQDQQLLSQIPAVIFLPVTQIHLLPKSIAEFTYDLKHNYRQEVVVVSSQVVAQMMIDAVTPQVASSILVASVGETTSRLLGVHGFKLVLSNASSSKELLDQLTHSTHRSLWYPRAMRVATEPDIYHSHMVIKEYQLYDHRPLTIHQLDTEAMAKIRTIHQQSPQSLITSFGSPTIYHTYRASGLPFGRCQIAIGTTTAKAMKAGGLSPIVARKPSVAAMVDAALQAFQA